MASLDDEIARIASERNPQVGWYKGKVTASTSVDLGCAEGLDTTGWHPETQYIAYLLESTCYICGERLTYASPNI